MPTVIGKDQLCCTSEYKKYFNSIQELGSHTLFKRYNAIENIVNNYIDEKFRHFLAQPLGDEDLITWFSIPYSGPQQLSELKGEEKLKYEQIKKDTIAHFKNVISSLTRKEKIKEADCLDKAIKFVDDRFVYCFEDKTVLGIWGMQLRENVREPLGIAMKNLFLTDQLPEPESQPEPPFNSFTVSFNSGEGGDFNGNSELKKHYKEIITETEVPKIETKEGYEFIGWDINPNNYTITRDTEFTALYTKTPPSIPPLKKLPWYNRFWNWLRGLIFSHGYLKRLFWLLLLLFILLLFWWLYRSISESQTAPIPYPIEDKPFVRDDQRSDRGGIYNPGDPYNPVPTPPEYLDVLPPKRGVLPPIDTAKIIRNPGKPVIIGNRLNILMENEDKSIMNLAKDFKVKYPDDKYKVVYYDDVVKRMQIEVPDEERAFLKQEIPEKFAPEYELFVFDESLMEIDYTPNDPAFKDPDKSWYLKEINAPEAWSITLGSNKLTVAIIDNGFSLKHPELRSKVVMPYNVWLQSKDIFPQTIDHGTHVAGTALAIIDNGQGLCGIAPKCAFMPVQVANRQGLMTTTSVVDGVLYALYQGADVINICLGLQFTDNLPENVQRDFQDNHFKEEELLWKHVMKISNKHKATIVMAAGNNNILAGVDPMKRPKNFIVVSAVDKNIRQYKKAGFSNYGEYSSISAPGVNIYSTVGSNNYTTMDGTSMAAPIVSGGIALMKSLNPDLTGDQIICILQSTGIAVEGKIGNLIKLNNALEKVQSGEFSDCDIQPEIPTSGEVQVILSWNNYNDLDLAVTDPDGNIVWHRNKQVPSGGLLEIDMNVNPNHSKTPIENIFWPQGAAPFGNYEVYLWHYKQHEPYINDTPYKLTVKYGDKTEEFSGTIKHEDGYIHICTFTLGNTTNTQNPNNPNRPSPDNSREKLLQERERLMRELDKIDSELQRIRNNTNLRK